MRFRATSVLLVAVTALVAGCGGSGNAPTSSPTTAPASSASSSASGGTSFASSTNCGDLRSLAAKYSQAVSAAFSGGHYNLQTAVSAYQSLANAAPAEIRPDLQVVAQAFASFASALTKAGYTPGKVPTASQRAAIQRAVQAFNSPQLRAAGQRLTAWGRTHCH